MRANVIVIVALLLGGGCLSLDSALQSALSVAGSQELSVDTMVAGLKDALRVGTGNAVASTSVKGGFANNPTIRIPLPAQLSGMASTLRTIGLGSQVDAFEGKMNEAAELAAREATPVFIEAVTKMTFADAKGILFGNETAATDYFRKATGATIQARYAPIVQTQMDKVGVVRLYDDLRGRYNKMPLVPKVDARLEDYVAGKATDGLFTVLADEEMKIRQDPAARTTELLKKVFGAAAPRK